MVIFQKRTLGRNISDCVYTMMDSAVSQILLKVDITVLIRLDTLIVPNPTPGCLYH